MPDRPQPPHLIFAGAGTGKTTTITAKSAHMVEKANNIEYKTFINSKMNKLIQKRIDDYEIP